MNKKDKEYIFDSTTHFLFTIWIFMIGMIIGGLWMLDIIDNII